MPEKVASKLSRKGLAEGSMGLLAIVTLGVSTVAPAYALTATIGPTALVVGEHMPVVFLVGFLPMSPQFGSGSSVFGVGPVFLLGVGTILLGVILMSVISWHRPGFFRGETLRRDTPSFTG
jgi:hypothetical protein